MLPPPVSHRRPEVGRLPLPRAVLQALSNHFQYAQTAEFNCELSVGLINTYSMAIYVILHL